MNTIVLLVILMIVVLLTRREPFTELFGLSGYNKPVGDIQFNDPVFAKDGYVKMDAMVDSDVMEKLVLTTNKELSKRLKICTYIIETIALERYKLQKDADRLMDVKQEIDDIKKQAEILTSLQSIESDANNEFKKVFDRLDLMKAELQKKVMIYNNLKNTDEIYECMFMVVKDSGFAFGFSIVSTVHIKNGIPRVVSLRSQPMFVNAPSNIKPYIQSTDGQEFIDYDIVDDFSVIKRGEFQSSKNKLM